MNEGAKDAGCTDPIGSQDSQFSVDSVIMDPNTKMHRSPHRAHLENKMRTKGGMANEGANEGGANHISRNHNNGIIIAVVRMLTILIPR